MRPVSLVLALALALAPLPARAEAAQRGWLTGLGIGLLVVGVGGLGAGLGGLVASGDASARLTAYTSDGITADEASTVVALQARVGDTTALAVIGLLVGGLAAAGGVACLVLDGGRRATVALAPMRGGALLGVTLEF